MTHLYDALAPVLGLSSAIALFLVMVLLLRGPIRQYWVVLLYVCWELIATVGLTVADLLLNGTAQAVGPAQMATSRLYARFYWTNALIEDLLLLVLTTVLIYKVAARPSLGRLLGGLVLVMVVLPFMLFHPTFKPMPRVAWFNSTNQLLNFGASIMNVILWGALIRSRRRDSRLMGLSIGLGILVTGAAVSCGLRHFIPHGGFTAAFNLFLNLTQLAAWLIWFHAFYHSRYEAWSATSPRQLNNTSTELLSQSSRSC
jgi:hypothetical protein